MLSGSTRSRRDVGGSAVKTATARRHWRSCRFVPWLKNRLSVPLRRMASRRLSERRPVRLGACHNRDRCHVWMWMASRCVCVCVCVCVLGAPCSPVGHARVTPRSWQHLLPQLIVYQPNSFMALRNAAGLKGSHIAASLSPNAFRASELKAHFSEGASSSFFCRSKDERFVLKTAEQSEVQTLLKMLPAYIACVLVCLWACARDVHTA